MRVCEAKKWWAEGDSQRPDNMVLPHRPAWFRSGSMFVVSTPLVGTVVLGLWSWTLRPELWELSLFKLDLPRQCSTCPAALKLRSTRLHVVGTVRGKLAPSNYLAQTANSQLNRVYRDYMRAFTEHDASDILWQKARALWKTGRALLARGDEADERESQRMLNEAVQIYWNVGGLATDEGSMTAAIWDAKVWYFQYR